MKKNYRLTAAIASVMIGLFVLQLVPVKTIDGHDNIVQAGFCDDTDLDYIVDGAYSRIPEKITKSFEDDGLKVVFKNRIAYEQEFRNSSAGVTNYNKDGSCKEIDIRSEAENTNKDMAIVHEFGHYFDSKLNNISQSAEWKRITEEECRNSRAAEKVNGQYKWQDENGDLYFTDPAEFFAQEFYFYCDRDFTDGQEEAVKCPEAQQFMTRVVEKF